MKHVLVTGCSGFLASYLIPWLKKNKVQSVLGVTDIQDCPIICDQQFHLDIRHQESVAELIGQIRPDVIFHLAAVTNVGFSWKNPSLTYEVNLIGTSNLLEAVIQHNLSSKVILMSSAEIYGGSESAAADNKTGVMVKNPYALSKFAMEKLGELYVHSKNMNIVTVRSYNFTGPGQNPMFVASDFARQIASIELGLQMPEIRVGNLSAIRDFSDVRDIARYLYAIAEAASAGDVIDICSGTAWSIADMLNILLSLSKIKITTMVDQSKLRPVDILELKGNNTILRERFKLLPEYSFEQTLTDLLNYWRHHLSKPLHS